MPLQDGGYELKLFALASVLWSLWTVQNICMFAEMVGEAKAYQQRSAGRIGVASQRMDRNLPETKKGAPKTIFYENSLLM
jgi:hypothetical protein